MPRLLWISIPFLLAACVGPMPAPDPRMAWVDLQTREVYNMLMSERLDGKRLDDGRYFQVSPGAHVLEASLRYYFNGPARRNTLPINCTLRLRYPDFAAGQRYRLEAWTLSNQIEAVLYDAQNRELAEAEVLNCWQY
jgi:hypothetical protein